MATGHTVQRAVRSIDWLCKYGNAGVSTQVLSCKVHVRVCTCTDCVLAEGILHHLNICCIDHLQLRTDSRRIDCRVLWLLDHVLIVGTGYRWAASWLDRASHTNPSW